MDEQHRVHLVGGNDDETTISTLFDEGEHCRLRLIWTSMVSCRR
jgi:hypothetical protein